MKTETYPKIGQRVDYVRQTSDGGVQTGTARILALTIDPNKRLMAHLDTEKAEGSEKFNVHVTCLNPSAEFIDQFTKVMNDVTALSTEGNGKVSEVVAEYNQRVDVLQAEVLGEAISFED